MNLQTYRDKRTFSKTPEPKAGKTTNKKQGKKPIFVVQKHYASHLHYDFRLEVDGVLKSWAVPKGPSLDPTIKRLARQVEDHPFSYRRFEGMIPKGNYGAGEVIVWDEGVFDCENVHAGLKKGHLEFLLYGQKLNGEFDLIQMKNDPLNWLLIKRDDEFATTEDVLLQENSVLTPKIPTRSLPLIHPMLATLVAEPFDKKDWVFEIKWDGFRAIAETGQIVKLYSRNHSAFEKKFPTIVKALESISRSLVLDGEIVGLDSEGLSQFHLIQHPTPQTEVVYMVFDLLYIDGESIEDLPLSERKKRLKALLPSHPSLRFSDHVEQKGKAFFKAAEKMGQEGIIAKDCQSIYLQNTRSKSWLKIKTHQQQEVVIAGFTHPRGSRKDIGALLLGVYKKGVLTYVGHTGTGFTENELSELRQKLNKHIIPKSPFITEPKPNAPVTWVEPLFLAEVRFQEWTQDGVMRQPVFMGLREDKPSTEVIKEKPKSAKKILEEKKVSKSKGLPVSEVTFSHLDKIYWPEKKLTKKHLIDYYDSVASLILPYLRNRPIVLRRFPDGIHGQDFFQKDVEFDTPEFVKKVEVYSESNKKILHMMLCQNKDTLLYMANLGSIELNPWHSRISKPEYPDYMVIDLDPNGAPFQDVIEVAQALKEVCDEMKMTCCCKTSGKTGLHIAIPLGAAYSYEQVKEFAHFMVSILNSQFPEITSLERLPGNRKAKLYLDYLQNRYAQTIVAPYSVRPTLEAGVSTPLHWNEVKKGLDPTQFTIQTIHKRLSEVGDLWKPVLSGKINLKKIITTYDA